MEGGGENSGQDTPVRRASETPSPECPPTPPPSVWSLLPSAGEPSAHSARDTTRPSGLTSFPERLRIFRLGAFCTRLDMSSSLYSLLLLKFKDKSCGQGKVERKLR